MIPSDNLTYRPPEPDYGSVPFPFDEVCARLDGEPKYDVTDRPPALAEPERTALAIKMLVEFMVSKAVAPDGRAVKSIGIRAIAAAWVINPDFFGGLSAKQLAKRFKISFQHISYPAREFSKTFGIQNDFQKHDCKRNTRKH